MPTGDGSRDDRDCREKEDTTGARRAKARELAEAETLVTPGADKAENRPSSDERASQQGRQGNAFPASTHDGKSLIGERVGHFRIVELLGKGGMGAVFRAHDERLHRDVALKVLRTKRGKQDVHRARLLHEARAAAAVPYKHIASVYEVGEEDHCVYIAMELVEGRTLRQILGKPLSLDDALRIALQIAATLERAHAKQLLHRDLKPENVMIALDGDVKILDFGLAKRMGSLDEPALAEALPEALGDVPYATQPGAIMGTPGYMSPEQLMGRELDPRSDIFAFGTILYEMLTGAQPFRGDLKRSIFKTLRDAPPVPPSDIIPALPPELDRLISQCIAKKLDARPESMREVLDALTRIATRVFGHNLLSPGILPRAEGGAPAPAITRVTILPRGTIAMLVTVLADASWLAQQHGDDYTELLVAYHEQVTRVVEEIRGQVATVSDEEILSAFTSTEDALKAAIRIHQVFDTTTWPSGARAFARMGLHTGEPTISGERYVGLELHRALRIGEAAPIGYVLLSETAHAALPEALLSHMSLADLGTIRIKDLHAPERIYALSVNEPPISRSLITTSRSLITTSRSIVHDPGGIRHPLPVSRAAFIGRVSQFEAIVRAFRTPGVRLVTLWGVGGIGKTRLSVEVTHSMAPDFPDGVVQVLLSSLEDPKRLPNAIAGALGIVTNEEALVLDAVAAAIGDASMLLVLDTFDHIIDAASGVVALLDACENLRILVTSRELLQVSYEHEIFVPPLALPPAGETSFEAIAASEAVRLFVDRARHVRPDFSLTAANAKTVAAICARLEAIPLSIELCASRAKMLFVDELHDRLSSRLELLKMTARDREPRHCSLRAALDWSYDRLDEPLKVLYRRTSVFASGFTIGAAETVCADNDKSLNVLDGVHSLVAKSLLRLREVDGAPRIVPMETIVEHAREHLDASPDRGSIHARHAEYFGSFVDKHAPLVLTRDWQKAAATLRGEADNIRAALTFTLAGSSTSLTARILSALLWFWFANGDITEGRGWAERALAQVRSVGSIEERAAVLYTASWLAVLSGDIETAKAESGRATAIWGALERDAEKARTSAIWGMTKALTGSPRDGLRMVEAAHIASRRRGDLTAAALAVGLLAELARAQGDYEEAVAKNEECIALLMESGNQVMASLFEASAAHCHLQTGNWAKAAACVARTLDLYLFLNNPRGIASYVAVMGGVAVARGKPIDGLRLFGAYFAELRRIGALPRLLDKQEIERAIQSATQTVGAEAAQKAQSEGASWSRDEAIAMTLLLQK